MASPCPICESINCSDTQDSDLYSLESSLFPFVPNCPAGFDCNSNDSINMVCCGQLLTAAIPPNATASERTQIIDALANQCSVRQAFCGRTNPDTPPTTKLFFNAPKTCQFPCSDGSIFTYTVAAGIFLGLDQATADSQAQAFACIQAQNRKICLGSLPGCSCKGSAYSAQIIETGGIGPFSWAITAGALPNGLSLSSSGLISGTLTTAGTFGFTVRITSSTGGFTQKNYSITVLDITTAALPPFTVGVPYSFQLQATGGSGNYSWKIASGSLPAGLTMSITGLISGTPL